MAQTLSRVSELGTPEVQGTLWTGPSTARVSPLAVADVRLGVLVAASREPPGGTRRRRNGRRRKRNGGTVTQTQPAGGGDAGRLQAVCLSPATPSLVLCLYYRGR